MNLFHTTDRIIKSPDIHAGRTNADFGPGFYISTDEELAGLLDDGQERRRNAEAELTRIEEELKEKLIEASSHAIRS